MKGVDLVIADDDRDLCELLAFRCRGLGLTVELAHDALAALAAIEAHPPRLAILDVNMPSGNGLPVCELMSRHESLAGIPVIVLTGDPDHEIVRRCHQLCAYYVPKGGDAWSRIEPLLRELLAIEPPPSPPTAPPAGSPGAIVAAAGAGTSEPPGGQPATARPAAAAGPPGDRAPARQDAAQRRPQCPPQPAAGDEYADIDRVFAELGWNRSPAAASRAADDSRAAEEPGPPWVLAIEDDVALSNVLKMRLAREGVDLLRAFSGTEGFRVAFTSPARAVILDYELPEGRGDYVLRRLKENPCTKDIPVIVLTGRREHYIERTMYNLGAVAVLHKPCPWETLWKELRRHLPVVAES